MPDRATTMAHGTQGQRGLPFQYAVLRVVPDIERGERVNAGIVLMCRSARFLEARVELDEDLVGALAPGIDLAPIRRILALVPAVCAGDPEVGPIARLEAAEHFHWVVAPSSTVVQPSAVHTGLTDDPAATLAWLVRRLVRRPAARCTGDPGRRGRRGPARHAAPATETPGRARPSTTATDALQSLHGRVGHGMG